MMPSLIPEKLHRYLSSRAPGGELGAVMIDRNGLLNGNENKMAAFWLTDEERQQLNRYTFEKRRSEWFLGRICAKQSVIELLGSSLAEPLLPQDISIEVSASGRPYLGLPKINGANGVPDISISHSHDKVIAIAGNCGCGVDIQLLTDTLFKVKDRFSSEAELALLASTSEDELVQLGMLWVAKEAIRKWGSTPHPNGFLDMHLESIRYDGDYRLLDFLVDVPDSGFQSVSTVVYLEENYCLGVCTSEGTGRNA
jgi:phosphopantetheinyl transferase (holo-ACP synthase)